MKLFPYILAATTCLCAELPVSLQLNNPEYKDGVMTTVDGGVLKMEGIRIQARNIQYTKKEGQCSVIADGDLVVDYGGRIFVGEHLDFDLETKSGTLTDAMTQIDGWLLGGKKITLLPDRSFQITDAYVTTSTTKKRDWEIFGGKIEGTPEGQIAASNVGVRAYRIPIFWIPGFRADLSKFSDSPVRYSIDWDRGQGPRFSMKYTLYSWDNGEIYGRVDYRWSRGPGGAIGGEYHSDDKRTRFKSENYYAYDTYFNDNDPNKRRKRFRLQGKFEHMAQRGNTLTLLAYDRISDKNMPLDFHMEDFEHNKARQTQAAISHHQKYFLAELDVRPRINGFQGFKQQLPTLTFNSLPLTIPQTGIVMENRLDLSFLDYVYSNDIDGIVPNFTAFRGEYTNSLYRPITSGPAIFTPFAGLTVIYYSDSPINKPVSQTVYSYGTNFQLNLKRDFGNLTHSLIPYTEYKGLSHPTHTEDDYYIFGIDDGYHLLNMLRIGAKNDVYFNSGDPFSPTFQSDIYTLGFFDDTTFTKAFPKINLECKYKISNFVFRTRVGWNAQNTVFDYANFALEWTASADYAFSIQFFHRSKYFWRKDDFNNYILDVTRPIPELLDSPLSDGRNTLLTKAQLRITPQWLAQIETRSGWGRGAREKGYTEARVNLYTMITTSWQMKLSYMHTVRDDQVSVSFKLKN